MKYPFLVLLLSCLSFLSCKKDPGLKPGDLEGVIRNEYGQAIPGVVIQVNSLSAISNSEGRYSLKGLASQEHTVSVSGKSYQNQAQQVKILPSVATTLDFKLKAGEPYIEILDSVFKVKPEMGVFQIKVSSNVEWTIKNSSSWIKTDIQSGKGSSLVTINYPGNPDSDRYDILEFISGSIKKRLIVGQGSRPKIIKFEGRIGNPELGIANSVYLQFDRQISEVSIINDWYLCESPIRYNYIENRRGLTFSIPCVNPAGKYSFRISLTDVDRNYETHSISVSF